MNNILYVFDMCVKMFIKKIKIFMIFFFLILEVKLSCRSDILLWCKIFKYRMHNKNVWRQFYVGALGCIKPKCKHTRNNSSLFFIFISWLILLRCSQYVSFMWFSLFSILPIFWFRYMAFCFVVQASYWLTISFLYSQRPILYVIYFFSIIYNIIIYYNELSNLSANIWNARDDDYILHFLTNNQIIL